MSHNLEMLKDAVCHWIEQSSEEFVQLSRKMYDEPELGFAEWKAAEWLTEALTRYGYTIEKGIANMPTSFRGTLAGNSAKLNIALLCEYDALPDIGHGCGHNMIGTASVWASAALASLKTQLPGTITVFGAPGEETDGGKVFLVNHHCFDDVDAALMFHPSSENRILSSSLALDAYEVTFHGKTAHAAGDPHLGINALDAAILTFNGINALRQHIKDDARIHGIISEGGKAPNVVPDLAQIRFYLRAKDRNYLNELVQKFENICKGACLMTGATYEMRKFENSNDNLITNRVIGELFEKNLHTLGITNIEPYEEGGGSTDMGNVSQVVPSLHSYLFIGKVIGHSREFAKATISPLGEQTLKNAAKALAMTVLDLLYKPEQLVNAKAELVQSKQNR